MNTMSKRQLRQLLTLVVFILGAVGYFVEQQGKSSISASTDTSSSTISHTTSTMSDDFVAPVSVSFNATVTHVADGDTIEALRDGETEAIKIRLLGVNTPETVDPRRPVECFGKEASDFAKKTLDGQRVRLEEDSEADNVDKYGRFLRNVILKDGRNFNEVLVKEGYAYAYVSFPMSASYKATLRRLETEAKMELRGLWNPATCGGIK